MAFTYFFRDMDILGAIGSDVVPKLRGRRYINIWDAGCAIGAEPYSLAIVLRENMGRFAFRNVTIHATDIDVGGKFANVINEGVYPRARVERMPDDALERYFVPMNGGTRFRVTREMRKAVRYQQHDLLSLSPIRTGLTLILCKNVLLHFTPQQRIDVIRMFHRALAPDGLLAVEQTQKLPGEVSGLFEHVRSDRQLFRRA